MTMERHRIASLIDLYVAGVISADELAELRRCLGESPAVRAQYDRHISNYCAMHPDAALPTAAEFLAQWDAPLEMEVASTPAPAPRTTFFSTTPWSYFHGWRGWGVAAACIIVGLLVLRQQQQDLRPLPFFEPPAVTAAANVATLRHAADVQWIGLSNEVFVGDSFGPRRLQIAGGAMEIEFKYGARLVIEGPADLQLISESEAFLHSGKVTAHVPETAIGFKVTAPAVAVTDLGTEFGLRAATNAPPEVHVFSGVVEMARLTMEPKYMKQGQAVRLEGSRVRNFTATRDSFLFQDQLVERERKEQQQRLGLWKAAARQLSEDPATVVHYTFEERNESGKPLANGAPRSRPETAGNIEGCNWTPGRWPEKQALSFGKKTDRVRFTVPNTLTSLTYMAWLRVDSLLNLSNALAITETMQLGEVHWQIYRDGRVALSARSGSGATVDQSWDRGLSPAIFTAERMGKWTQLVSVYDASTRTIRHYVNGEFVSATPIARPLPLKLGAVEIANWGVRVDQPRWASMKSYAPSYLNRHWSGCIDEFALLSRALTPEEIRDYYQRGRVAAGMAVANARLGPSTSNNEPSR
jgi:hypothetical protein